MRKIEQLVVHCSATEAGRDFHAADIDRWHRDRGFACIGYHFVIALDGTIEDCRRFGRSIDTPGAHVSGHNAYTIGICLIGGVRDGKPDDTFTAAQYDSLFTLLTTLRKSYPLADILGHRDFRGVAKACPSFDVREWCKARGIAP